MAEVLLALVPAIIAIWWYFGWGVIINIGIAIASALFAEAAMLRVRGRPVAVGGSSKRGVVAAAIYEVRKFGVRSAMSMADARRRCPNLVQVRPRMAHYKAVSKQIFAIFRGFTPLVEGLSRDEAFLDVTGSEQLFGAAPEIGRKIKQAVRDEVLLVVSVGVAPNKFLANGND